MSSRKGRGRKSKLSVLETFEKDLEIWKRAHNEMLQHRIQDLKEAVKVCGRKPRGKAAYCNAKTEEWTEVPSKEKPKRRKPRSRKSKSKSRKSSRR